MKHPYELIQLVQNDRLDPLTLNVEELESIVDNLIARRQSHRESFTDTQRKLGMMDGRREYAKELRKDRKSTRDCLRQLNESLRYYSSLLKGK